MTQTESGIPQYWRPEPKLNDWMFWCILVPCVVYVVGVILYGGLAMVATNGEATASQRVGSVLMVIGGETTTLFSVMEVFRKRMTVKEIKKKKSLWTNEEVERKVYADSVWDWLGLFASLVATLGALFVVFTRQTTIAAPWVSWTIVYGPLVLLLCSVFDMYAAAMELGMRTASWEERWQEWNDAKHTWIRGELARQDKLARELREHELQIMKSVNEPHEVVDETTKVVVVVDESHDEDDELPDMHVKQWDLFVQGEGRTRPDVQAARVAENGEQVELVNRIVRARGFKDKAPSTARDWAKRIPPKES